MPKNIDIPPHFANFILFIQNLGITPFGVYYDLQLISAKSGSNKKMSRVTTPPCV